MEMTSQIMPFILCMLLSILIVFVIIFVYKLIITLDKTNDLLDDVSTKVKKLDNLFEIIDRGTDTLNVITNKVSDGVLSFVMKLFKKRKDDDNE